jgi:hypothetical protein
MKLSFATMELFLMLTPVDGVRNIISNMCITSIGMRISQRDNTFETE